MSAVKSSRRTHETAVECDHDLTQEISAQLPQQQARKGAVPDPFSLAPAKPEGPFEGRIEHADGSVTRFRGEDRGGGPNKEPNGVVDTLRMERRDADEKLTERATRVYGDRATATSHQLNTDQDLRMDVQALTVDQEGYSVTEQITDGNEDGLFGAHDHFENYENGALTSKGWDHTGDGKFTEADGTMQAALGTLQKHMESQMTAANPTGDRLDEAGLKKLAAQGGILGDAAARAAGMWGRLDQAQNPQDTKDGFVGAGDIKAHLAQAAAAPTAEPRARARGETRDSANTPTQAPPRGVKELDRRVERSHDNADKTEKLHQATKELQLHGIGGIHEGIGAVQKDKATDIGSYLEGRADAQLPGAKQRNFQAGARAVDDLVESYDAKKDTEKLGLLGTVRSKLRELGLWEDQGVQDKFRDGVTEGAGAVRDIVDSEVKREIASLQNAGRTQEAKDLKSRLATFDTYAQQKEQIKRASPLTARAAVGESQAPVAKTTAEGGPTVTVAGETFAANRIQWGREKGDEFDGSPFDYATGTVNTRAGKAEFVAVDTNGDGHLGGDEVEAHLPRARPTRSSN